MNILLALDGSAESLEATQVVANLPWGQKPQVTVVTALVESTSAFRPASASEQLKVAEKEHATLAFRAAKEMLQDTCEVAEQVIAHEHPRRLILDAARRNDADLIVMGARGHSAAYRVVLGSTADYVANHAKCSVLLVRKSEEVPAHGEAGHRIVVAYDGSEESVEAYRQLCELKWPAENTHLHLSMILDRPKLLPEDVVYDPPHVAESEAVLANLKRPEQLVDRVTQSVRESLHIGNAIRRLAEKKQADLLFIGGTGKSDVASFFLGSTARYVMHHAHCDIWLARAKAWK